MNFFCIFMRTSYPQTIDLSGCIEYGRAEERREIPKRGKVITLPLGTEDRPLYDVRKEGERFWDAKGETPGKEFEKE